MRFTHLAEQIYHRPWFITAEAHASIRLVFERALTTGLMEPKAAEINLMDMFPKRRPLAISEDGVASIHILGPLGKNLSKMEQSCGATGFEQIRSDYAEAIKKEAKGIVLDFDSPGGTITGTPEMAALIANTRIPTVAYTEDICASAAYYLASGANRIVASPSASVGSIGVYIPWMDTSAAYEKAGVKPDPIVNTGGDLKAIGFGGKLTEAQRAHLQSEVDADFADFKNFVRAARPGIPDSAMRGQVLGGRSALDSKLVDCIGEMDCAQKLVRALMADPLATAA